MILYANELIKEIQDNKPNDATPITIYGATISSVRYNGVGLNIECCDEFIEKSEFDYLQEEYESVDSEYNEMDERVEELENALVEIREILDNKTKLDDETIDEIYDIIRGVNIWVKGTL